MEHIFHLRKPSKWQERVVLLVAHTYRRLKHNKCRERVVQYLKNDFTNAMYSSERHCISLEFSNNWGPSGQGRNRCYQCKVFAK
jgi:hypothetical protein